MEVTINQAKDFFHLLYHLIKTPGSSTDLTQVAKKKLSIRPKAAMNFPTRDVYDVEEEDDLIILNCHFMGLYGVDSPLPMYFNVMCLRNDELGQTLRDFLDVFNHRSYVLYFLAWLAFQPEKAVKLGDLAYLDVVRSFAGHSICSDNLALANSAGKCNIAHIYSIISHILPSVPVVIHECVPHWSHLDQALPLGNESLGLGDNMLLGNRFFDGNHLIRIVLGPISWDIAAQILPEGEKASLFIKLLRVSLETIIHFELQIKIIIEENCLALGVSPAHLGHQTWLGDWLEGYYVINVSEERYDHCR